MIKPHDDEYWSKKFAFTLEDLDHISGRLEQISTPQDLKALAFPILKERIEHGQDVSPAVVCGISVVPIVRPWDPAGEWEVGDPVLVPHDRFGNSRYEALLGEVTCIDPESAEIQLESLGCSKTYLRVLAGKENDQRNDAEIDSWQHVFPEAMEKMLDSDHVDEQVEGILLKYGGPILTCLAGALQADHRFTSFEGKWHLVHRLPRIDRTSLQTVHTYLLENSPASLENILPVIIERSTTDETLLRMALHTALQQSPDRFENLGTSIRPRWKALLPNPEQAEVTHYAYDSQTYEVLCRPGQRLSRKIAKRLQELHLYAYIVTFGK